MTRKRCPTFLCVFVFFRKLAVVSDKFIAPPKMFHGEILRQESPVKATYIQGSHLFYFWRGRVQPCRAVQSLMHEDD